MGEIIFKTELIKGAKGDRGEAGQADSIPTDGVIAFQGETVPDGYEETDPGDVFDEVYEDINAVKDMIADEYDTTATYNAGDFCIHENALYKCTATTIGPWDNSKWVLTSASDETKTNTAATEATQDMISDAYNSSGTYNVGDYCIYENALYKCKTASTTGTWDFSKWDAVTVAEELEELTESVESTSIDIRTALHLQYNGCVRVLHLSGCARRATTSDSFENISSYGVKPTRYPVFAAGTLAMDGANNYPCTIVCNTNGEVEVYYKDGAGEYVAPEGKVVYGTLTWIL
jgi:hypothetical protein